MDHSAGPQALSAGSGSDGGPARAAQSRQSPAWPAVPSSGGSRPPTGPSNGVRLAASTAWSWLTDTRRTQAAGASHRQERAEMSMAQPSVCITEETAFCHDVRDRTCEEGVEMAQESESSRSSDTNDPSVTAPEKADENWQEKRKRALRAREIAKDLREGKPKSFRSAVGRAG